MSYFKPFAQTAENNVSLPLHIHMANQIKESGLDITHVGGSSIVTEAIEVPAKKQRLCDEPGSIASTGSAQNDGLQHCDATVTSCSGIPFLEDCTEFSDESNIEASPGFCEHRQLVEFNVHDPDQNLGKEDSNGSISDDEIEVLFEKKGKVVLKVKGQDHFDILPEGWIEVIHNSGMPIYLHKQSRVCCVSKPYFLGSGSTRKHEIPTSAIPCLHYLNELKKEKAAEKEKEEQIAELETRANKKENVIPSVKPQMAKDNRNENALPPVKIKSVKDSLSLDFMAVREYCMKRFEFQTITVQKFKSWAERRKHKSMMKAQQRPTLPDNTKLITCPVSRAFNKSIGLNNTTKEFVLNPSGKTTICILHEYVQHTLRLQPRYVFKALESASTPYGAVVLINDMEYGSGCGSSKKQAKTEAAKAALEILIPEMKTITSESQESKELQDVKFFDEVRVEDPRVGELSFKAGQFSPYQILLECLKRNYGMEKAAVNFDMKTLKHMKNEVCMSFGKHTVSVICKNKREGKQRASQALLQLLHPHVNSWGLLLRMYGKGSCKPFTEKKESPTDVSSMHPTLRPADVSSMHPALRPAAVSSMHPALRPADVSSMHPALKPADVSSIHPALRPADISSIHSALRPADSTICRCVICPACVDKRIFDSLISALGNVRSRQELEQCNKDIDAYLSDRDLKIKQDKNNPPSKLLRKSRWDKQDG